jgi:hypothetical protein
MIVFGTSSNAKNSRSCGSCSSSLSFLCIDDLTGVEGPRRRDVDTLRLSLSDIGERERDIDDEDTFTRDILVSISRYQIDIDEKTE